MRKFKLKSTALKRVLLHKKKKRFCLWLLLSIKDKGKTQRQKRDEPMYYTETVQYADGETYARSTDISGITCNILSLDKENRNNNRTTQAIWNSGHPHNLRQQGHLQCSHATVNHCSASADRTQSRPQRCRVEKCTCVFSLPLEIQGNEWFAQLNQKQVYVKGILTLWEQHKGPRTCFTLKIWKDTLIHLPSSHKSRSHRDRFC